MEKPFLHARAALHKPNEGRCSLLDVGQAVQAVRAQEGLIWLHIVGSDDVSARAILEDQLGYHELAVEDALSNKERPALQEYDQTVFFVLPAVVLNGEPQFSEVAFFLTDQSLVTYCGQRVEQVEIWFQRWLDRPYFAATAARIAHTVADAIIDAYFPVVDAIEDQVDEISDEVFSGNVEQVHRIQETKRQLLQIRRQLAPSREVMNGLVRRDLPAIPPEVLPYFQDVLDHILRLGELLDTNRDTLTTLLDVHLSSVSNNINQVMKRMTFISTALMSSALIAGIYGMNFTHMPELRWQIGYPMSLAMMLGAFFGVRYYFKRRGWL